MSAVSPGERRFFIDRSRLSINSAIPPRSGTAHGFCRRCRGAPRPSNQGRRRAVRRQHGRRYAAVPGRSEGPLLSNWAGRAVAARKKSPGPRSSRSCWAIRNPSLVSVMGPQARFGVLAAGVRKQDAVGFFGSAAHPAPQLVQLGQAELFGVFHDHDSGVWNIHPHFDHGGGYKDIQCPCGKSGHDAFFFRKISSSHVRSLPGRSGKISVCRREVYSVTVFFRWGSCPVHPPGNRRYRPAGRHAHAFG